MTSQWAALAHDLRSHLNAIQLSTDTARLGICSGRQIDLAAVLNRIERNARMALDLIDSRKMVRRPQLARRLSVPALRLDEIARETTEAMLPIAERAGVRVSVRAPAAVAVRGDRAGLSRVISNLLANAIRHSPEGSSIDVVVIGLGQIAHCQVADRGPGVPAGERERIFERHFQGRGMPGAAGLGLFICREIVEEHGGRIWVEDHLPQGARFAFAVPLERALPTLQPAQIIRVAASARLANRTGVPCG